MEVDDEAVLLDIDTFEDSGWLLRYRYKENIPNQEQCIKLLEEAQVEKPIRIIVAWSLLLPVYWLVC